jgi:hypothetical protein
MEEEESRVCQAKMEDLVAEAKKENAVGFEFN